MKAKDMIRNAGPDWSDREPYRSIVGACEALEARGDATAEELTDALLSVGLTFANQIGGPRLLAERLVRIAMKFAQDADLEDARGRAGDLVH